MCGRKDNVRALLILLQNPIFSAQSTYTVFAHVLQVSNRWRHKGHHLLDHIAIFTNYFAQNVTNLSNGDHQLLVHWFRSLDSDRLSGIARCVGS